MRSIFIFAESEDSHSHFTLRGSLVVGSWEPDFVYSTVTVSSATNSNKPAPKNAVALTPCHCFLKKQYLWEQLLEMEWKVLASTAPGCARCLFPGWAPCPLSMSKELRLTQSPARVPGNSCTNPHWLACRPYNWVEDGPPSVVEYLPLNCTSGLVQPIVGIKSFLTGSFLTGHGNLSRQFSLHALSLDDPSLDKGS